MSLADCRHSIEPQNDRAVYGEAGATKGFTARGCKELVLHKGEHLELLTQLTAETLVDGVLSPFVQVGIPRRAVIEGDCRDTTQDVVRPMAVRQVCRQPLTQRVVATASLRSICRNEDSFDGAGEGVIAAQLELLHQRGIGVVFDCCG